MGMQAVAPYLLGLRTTAGLTQDEAAALIGVAKKTIRRWEKAENEPALTELALYVERLGGEVQKVVEYLLDLKPAPADLDEPPGVIAARVLLASLPPDAALKLAPIAQDMMPGASVHQERQTPRAPRQRARSRQ